jgi:DNA (cytosine-5)-methyltransferase 1/DNA (cytosine-5)-methyltransferase 3A
MENVRMKKEFEEYITFHTQEALGKVNKHLVNSALVSAQNRKRFYWTNIDGIEQPEDQGLVLADILMDGHVDRDKSHCLDANYFKGGNPKSYFGKSRRQLVFDRPCELKDFDPKAECHHVATATDINGHDSIKRVYADSGKSPTINTMGGGNREPKVLVSNQIPTYRKLRPCECEALQTFPIGYTEGISNSQRYKCLGNSFTVSVVSHILSYAF